jgi:response regulator NasT
MTRSLRIAVADDEPDMQEYYRMILAELGHVVVVLAETGRELVEKCRAQHPDLVISDIKMPDMDGIAAATQIYRDRPVPLILVSAYNDPEYIARAEDEHILAYLVKPIKRSNLETAIAVALHRFELFAQMRKEAESLKQALADRKLIERAKGLLMTRDQFDETAAFRRLQKPASDNNRKLVEIARALLSAGATSSFRDEQE